MKALLRSISVSFAALLFVHLSAQQPGQARPHVPQPKTVQSVNHQRVASLTANPQGTTNVIQEFRGGPPTNDNCANAQSLTVGTNCSAPTAGDNSQATQSVVGPACDPTTTGIYADVWYSFNSGNNTSVLVDLVPGITMTDNVLVVLDGCTGTELLCFVLPVGPQSVAVNTNTNYIIRIYSNTQYGDPGPFTICVSSPGAAPANNDCAGAITLPVNQSCVGTSGTTAGATQSIAALTCATFTGDANDDVWYAFTATATTAMIEVDGSATFDAVVDLRSGACTGANIACADATVEDGLEVISATGLSIGAVYYIRVYHYAAAAPADPTFTICVYNFTGGGPANDLCSSVTPQAIAVPGSFGFSGDNTGATITDDGPFTTATVWHAFTTTACADIALSYCGTSPAFGNVWIQLAEQCPVTTYIESAVFNDVDCGNGNWTVYFEDVPAGTYYLPVLSEPGSVGPYNVTVTTVPCVSVAPINDQCANIIPQSLSIGGTAIFSGDNTGATTTNDYVPGSTWEIPPPILPSVWHAFTISACADITVELCGTTPAFGNVWIILATSCPGDDNIVGPGTFDNTSCGDGNYTVFYDDVPAGTYYLPVLSETGSFGPYTVTVNATACAGVGTCDGGLVLTSTFTTSEVVCSNGQADVISFINTSTSTESYDYILTDANNNIISLLAGGSFDFETAALGIYHVWGVSYNGVLTNVIPGAPVSGISSNGTCFDVSTNFVTVDVDICQGLSGQTANVWSVFPNPGNGDFTVRNGGTAGLITMEVFDLGGRSVYASTAQMASGQGLVLPLAGTLAQGSYTLRITNGDQRHEERLMVK
ncbi:MAG: T9SS type A sorting domain-containing protein [Flavobacteriales bacterium]